MTSRATDLKNGGLDVLVHSEAFAAYLLSDEARNVTGTTLYVDSGYHAMGM